MTTTMFKRDTPYTRTPIHERKKILHAQRAWKMITYPTNISKKRRSKKKPLRELDTEVQCRSQTNKINSKATTPNIMEKENKTVLDATDKQNKVVRKRQTD